MAELTSNVAVLMYRKQGEACSPRGAFFNRPPRPQRFDTERVNSRSKPWLRVFHKAQHILPNYNLPLALPGWLC